jgi:hypothetical protein
MIASSVDCVEHSPMGGHMNLLLTVIWLVVAQNFSGSDLAPAVCTSAPRGALRTSEFRAILNTVADAWNGGRTDVAVTCFTDDAIYMEPPDRQLYRGVSALREFFASSIQPPRPDRMRWHLIAFDESRQMGFGEYTYRGRQFYHGIAVLQLEAGRIRSWREYQYASPMPWEQFIGPSR